MKKLLNLLGLMLFCISLSQAQKIGHVNSVRFIDSLPEAKVLAQQLGQYEKSLSDQAEKMLEKFQTNVQKYQTDVQSGNLTPTQQKQIETDLQTEQAALQNYQQSARESLEKKRNELTKPLLEKIQQAVNLAGKELGYLMIFDSSVGLVIYPEAEDLTQEVLKRLK